MTVCPASRDVNTPKNDRPDLLEDPEPWPETGVAAGPAGNRRLDLVAVPAHRRRELLPGRARHAPALVG